MQPGTDPRHNSRIIALQRLFQKDFHSRHTLEEINSAYSQKALNEINEIGPFDKELTNTLVKDLPEYLPQIDALIEKLAPEWPIHKIVPIDLLILRLALLEGFFLKINPPKVVINEAIELAKEFSNEQTRMFVSGVLGNLYSNQAKYLS
jgi:N utilization substance protein B